MPFNLEELGFKEGQKVYYVCEAIVYQDVCNGSLEPDWVQYSEEWLSEAQWKAAETAVEMADSLNPDEQLPEKPCQDGSIAVIGDVRMGKTLAVEKISEAYDKHFEVLSEWKPFEKIGHFLRVVKYKSNEMIQACPMNKYGSMVSEEESCDVEELDTLFKDLFDKPDYAFSEVCDPDYDDDWQQTLFEYVKHGEGVTCPYCHKPIEHLDAYESRNARATVEAGGDRLIYENERDDGVEQTFDCPHCLETLDLQCDEDALNFLKGSLKLLDRGRNADSKNIKIKGEPA